MGKEYTCDECGGCFEAEWTEEEAIAEMEKKFPGLKMADAAEVCDDCYRKIMGGHQ